MIKTWSSGGVFRRWVSVGLIVATFLAQPLAASTLWPCDLHFWGQLVWSPNPRYSDFEIARRAWGELNTFWSQEFAARGANYEPAKLIFYNGTTPTKRCGQAVKAMGPFYCPPEHAVYLDLSFFTELVTRFKARGGEAVIPLVLAHEMGHHILELLGAISRTQQIEKFLDQAGKNQLQSLHEATADGLAGYFFGHLAVHDNLTFADLFAASDALRVIGDDNLAALNGTPFIPANSNHGTSDQREGWFIRGFMAHVLNEVNAFVTSPWATQPPNSMLSTQQIEGLLQYPARLVGAP